MSPEYLDALSTVRRVAEIAQAPRETVAQVLRLIHRMLPKYEWVGVYLLHGEALDLGPFVGADTVHKRIPVGKGVCGSAVLQRRNRVVEDVTQEANYLACAEEVRSEIVVLIWQGDKILGQIDADCSQVGGFTADDERFLQRVAELLAPAAAKLRAAGRPAASDAGTDTDGV